MTRQTLSVGPTPRIEISYVGGDLVLLGWDRSDLQVDGDDLQELGQEGSSLHISGGGDLKLSIPRQAQVVLNYVAGDFVAKDLQGVLEISYVGGDAKLQNLTGKVTVSGVIGDLQMDNVSQANIEPGNPGLGPDFSERIRRQVEAGTRRAQKQAEHAARRTEQRLRRLDRHGRSWKVNWAAGTTPPAPAGEPVSDEERMAILKMLQDKKITSEEAEKLLAALEGGS